jgi:hypothetical protein
VGDRTISDELRNSMSAEDHGRLPDDLTEIGKRLRAERTEASEIELDRIKRAAMARASRPARGSGVVRRQLVTVLLAGGLVIGGTAGVFAAKGGGGGGNGGSSNAGKKQYCPPTSQNPGADKPPVSHSCGVQNPPPENPPPKKD